MIWSADLVWFGCSVGWWLAWPATGDFWRVGLFGLFGFGVDTWRFGLYCSGTGESRRGMEM